MIVYVVIQYANHLGVEVQRIQCIVDSEEKAKQEIQGYINSGVSGNFKYQSYFLR